MRRTILVFSLVGCLTLASCVTMNAAVHSSGGSGKYVGFYEISLGVLLDLWLAGAAVSRGTATAGYAYGGLVLIVYLSYLLYTEDLRFYQGTPDDPLSSNAPTDNPCPHNRIFTK
ncbi:MAG: hypothetical protein RH862_05555 [Leptospiraceae bacterium]